MTFTPEIGQMVFSNTPWSHHETPDYVTDGISLLAEVIREQRGDEGLLTSNYGEEEYVNDRFEMRTYCWCDGDRHEGGCPPNFVHKPSGILCSWYKHANRGESISRIISSQYWAHVVIDCLKSLNPAFPEDHS